MMRYKWGNEAKVVVCSQQVKKKGFVCRDLICCVRTCLPLLSGTQEVRDSTGNMVGKPVFTQGKQEFSAAEIRFNFKTKKGVIFDNDKSTKF